mmetsp:Transcript_17308/g.26702  ORF Transcript_17308/g.26702 Transcript_17308/m.26702 type:complete len:116 (+) Transcript_17308:149-496(+)
MLDSFGHSSYNARMFAEEGFDAQFIGRSDLMDERSRKENKEMQFVWQPTDSDQILTHTLDFRYTSPFHFEFDKQPEQWGDDPKHVFTLAEELQERASYYKTSHLLVLFGDDFTYK